MLELKAFERKEKKNIRTDQSMTLISLHIPHYLVDEIQSLVDMLVFPNRSEAIRVFIRDGIVREYELDFKIKSRSKYFEFFKNYIKDVPYLKVEHIVAGYLNEILGINSNFNGKSKSFTTLRAIFTKFCELFTAKGYFEVITKSHPYTYKIINRGWIHD